MLYFCGQKYAYMKKSSLFYAQEIQDIERLGIVVMRDIEQYSSYNTDTICPFFVMALCHSGEGLIECDMRELHHKRNDLICLLPNHVLRPIESSEDYRTTIVIISQKMYAELKFHTFSHDADKFNNMPISTLTDEQAQRIMNTVDQLETIASRSEEELPHRYDMLMALLAVGYEQLNFYRREQDARWNSDHNATIYTRFCELVVEHYRESREVKYYADLLHLTPKYFSKVIRMVTGGMSPSNWIEQYVIAQAKRIMATHPALTIQETAYLLGFSEPSSFCRFFKRYTGVTAKKYRASVI